MEDKNIIEEKERIRTRILSLIDTEFESDAFKKAEAEIDALYEEGKGKLSLEADLLLKGGE